VAAERPLGERAARRAAFFDIDRTLLASNSAASFARYMREVGIARRRDLGPTRPRRQMARIA